MRRPAERQLALDRIESEADYVLFSEGRGLLSEHYTAGEARRSGLAAQGSRGADEAGARKTLAAAVIARASRLRCP